MRNWVGHHTLSVVWLSAYEMGEYSLLPNNVEKTIYLEKTCTYKHAHTCVCTQNVIYGSMRILRKSDTKIQT